METSTEKKENRALPVSAILDENYCVLMPKNFEEVYLFWRFSAYKEASFEKGEYAFGLRVKLVDGAGKKVMELTLPWEKGGSYIKLPGEDFKCHAEIYAVKDGREELLCSSAPIIVPAFSSMETLGSLEYGS